MNNKHKQQPSSTETLTRSRLSRLLGDNIIAGIIIITPFLFYSYMCFPDAKVWETYFFTFNSNYYESVSTFMWVFLQKFVWFLLMIIWFLTNSKWWNKALLVPIGMLLYQMIILVNDEIRLKDEPSLDKFVVLPIVVSVCIILFLISRRLYPLAMGLDLQDEIDQELQECMDQIKKPTV